MDSTDVTIQVLRSIHARLAEHGELFKAFDARFVALEQHAMATNEALGKLHQGITLTNETLGVIRERLGFAEAASAAASDARIRLDERVDRVEARLDQVESRIGVDD